MSGLRELQVSFARHLMTDDEAIIGMISETIKPDRRMRLKIYRHAYFARLIETLANDFPCLSTLLGEDDFSVLAQNYIEAHPSQHFSLRYFGRHLASYLGYSEHASEHDWQAEMALFEWAMVDSFDAPDEVPLSEADAAAIPPQHWPGLQFGFHPSVMIVDFRWNTLDRWRAVKQGNSIPAAQRLSIPNSCVVWRDELTTKFRSLDEREYIAFYSALNQESFSALCGRLAGQYHNDQEVPLLAAGYLKTWLAENMITRLLAD